MSGPANPQQGPPPPSPAALAVANFLRHNNDLKMRQGVLNGKRADFFRSKRALRALQSEKYVIAQRKSGSALPKIESEVDAMEAFRLLPMSQLAIRVEKLTRKTIAAKLAKDPKTPVPPIEALSKTKGVPTLSFIREQVVSTDDSIYYVWLWEKVPLKTYIYAGLIAAVIFAIVLFPLWPPIMRLGVWYLSVGMLGVLALFFAMAIFRLIFFGITYFVASPGLWLFPNLFEDVGFFDSFKPVYAWNVPPEKKSKRAKKSNGAGSEGAPQTEAKVTAVLEADDDDEEVEELDMKKR
ncbi:translocation protein Sec62-domain-containing protein [Kockiozyma suomiensis]|uniref:translocation protein Sec62-domain-containing protein n=1 Tax=Kockiozyma suomiensis TaxID=1337062 RepID=UPI00334419FA